MDIWFTVPDTGNVCSEKHFKNSKYYLFLEIREIVKQFSRVVVLFYSPTSIASLPTFGVVSLFKF